MNDAKSNSFMDAKPNSLMIARPQQKAYPATTFEAGARVSGVITLIAQGYSVARACREYDLSHATFYNALRRFDTLREQYAEAQRRACDALADALLDIRDDPLYGSDDPREQRVISDNIKWLLARKDRARYGNPADLRAVTTQTAATEITSALERARERVEVLS